MFRHEFFGHENLTEPALPKRAAPEELGAVALEPLWQLLDLPLGCPELEIAHASNLLIALISSYLAGSGAARMEVA